MALLISPGKKRSRKNNNWRGVVATACISFSLGVTAWALATNTLPSLAASAQDRTSVTVSEILAAFPPGKPIGVDAYRFLVSNFNKTVVEDGQTTSQTSNTTTNNTTTSNTNTNTNTSTSQSALSGDDLLSAAANKDLTAYFPMDDTAGPLTSLGTSQFSHYLVDKSGAGYGQDGKVGKAITVKAGQGTFCSSKTSGGDCEDAPAYSFDGSFTFGMWVQVDDPQAINGFVRKWESDKGSYIFSSEKNQWIGSLSHEHPDWMSGYCVQWKYQPDYACPPNAYSATPKGRSFRISSNLGLQAGQWYHLMFIRNTQANAYDVYVNFKKVSSQPGVTVQSGNRSFTSVMQPVTYRSTDPFFLGAFNGKVDEFFAMKKALSADEIKALATKYGVSI